MSESDSPSAKAPSSAGTVDEALAAFGRATTQTQIPDDLRREAIQKVHGFLVGMRDAAQAASEPIGYAAYHPEHGWLPHLAEKTEQNATAIAMRSIEGAAQKRWTIRPLYASQPPAAPVETDAIVSQLVKDNEHLRAQLMSQPEADPVDMEEVNYDRSSSAHVAWVAYAANGNIRFWTPDEGRARDERARGLDMRAFTLAELVALSAKRRSGSPVAAASDEAAAKLISQYLGMSGIDSEDVGYFRAVLNDTRPHTPLIKGAVYDLGRFGPAEYVGLDTYHGDTTHKFRLGDGQPRYIRQRELASLLSSPQSQNHTTTGEST